MTKDEFVRLMTTDLPEAPAYFSADAEINRAGPGALPALRQLIQKQADLQLIDVRRPAEYQSGHAPHARPAPLQHLRELLPRLNLEPSELTAIICAGGFRSSAAASIMQQAGFTNVINVNG